VRAPISAWRADSRYRLLVEQRDLHTSLRPAQRSARTANGVPPSPRAFHRRHGVLRDRTDVRVPHGIPFPRRDGWRRDGLVADLFPPADRGFYQGLSFAVFGAGMGLGGPIGGALTQVFGWRAAFYGLFHSFSVSRDSAAANRILTNTSVSHSSATRRYHGSDSGGTGSSCWGGCTNELEEARPGRLRRIFDPPAVGEWCNYPSICTSTSTVLA
jgi:hypothetical protein